jgi:hypothetical protein
LGECDRRQLIERHGCRGAISAFAGKRRDRKGTFPAKWNGPVGSIYFKTSEKFHRRKPTMKDVTPAIPVSSARRKN